MRTGLLDLAVAMAVTALASVAAAQGQTPAPKPTPAPLPASAPSPAASDPAAACYPVCRPGFLCHHGQCISACNPACGAGQSCGEGGQCVAAPPPPSYPAGTVYPQAPLAPNPEAEPGEAPGYQLHDGFMLRLTLGLGGAGTSIEAESIGDLQMSGLSGTFSVDIGGSIVEDLVLHVRFADFVIVNPELEIDGQDAGSSDELTATALLLGPAVSYYFMPINLYVTAAVGVSWLSLRYDNDDDGYTTDAGFGVNLDVGKEFWVGGSWGLGIAGRFWWSLIQDDEANVETDVSFVGGAVLFSATYQ